MTSLLPTPARDPQGLDYYGTNGDGSSLLRGIRGARAAVEAEALRDAASERCGSSEPDAGENSSDDEASSSGSDRDRDARAEGKEERARLLALVEAQAEELRELRARLEAVEAAVRTAPGGGAPAPPPGAVREPERGATAEVVAESGHLL